MKTFFFLFLFWTLGISAIAQIDIEPSQLIAADYFQTTDDNLEVSWVLGAFNGEYILGITDKTKDLDYYDEHQLRILGNPVTSHIEVETDIMEPLNYRLFNLLGRELLDGKASAPRFEIPVDKLDTQILLLSFYLEDGRVVKTFRIIKQ